jgi:hypothetical protein
LARELTVEQIGAIRAQVNTPLEYFIHDALCVAFSGQCHISHADTGRSANRGDCSQACRLPYTLTHGRGGVVAYDKHLLSMQPDQAIARLCFSSFLSSSLSQLTSRLVSGRSVRCEATQMVSLLGPATKPKGATRVPLLRSSCTSMRGTLAIPRPQRAAWISR